MAHAIDLPEPHSILGSAASPLAVISAVNSTHEKVVSHVATDAQVDAGEIEPVNRLAATGERELMVSAKDPNGLPEGFETRHGAPMVGVTSHPEAIHSDRESRTAAPPDAQDWSDNIFAGFAQSASAYRSKQVVNKEFRSNLREERREEARGEARNRREQERPRREARQRDLQQEALKKKALAAKKMVLDRQKRNKRGDKSAARLTKNRPRGRLR
jgi:hypothetical protein